MKILIAGDGETAIYLARQLSMEDQDVTVMGMDNKRLSEIDSRYNVMTTLGKPHLRRRLLLPERRKPTSISR